jgi:hypothetical protein
MTALDRPHMRARALLDCFWIDTGGTRAAVLLTASGRASAHDIRQRNGAEAISHLSDNVGPPSGLGAREGDPVEEGDGELLFPLVGPNTPGPAASSAAGVEGDDVAVAKKDEGDDMSSSVQNVVVEGRRSSLSPLPRPHSSRLSGSSAGGLSESAGRTKASDSRRETGVCVCRCCS